MSDCWLLTATITCVPCHLVLPTGNKALRDFNVKSFRRGRTGLHAMTPLRCNCLTCKEMRCRLFEVSFSPLLTVFSLSLSLSLSLTSLWIFFLFWIFSASWTPSALWVVAIFLQEIERERSEICNLAANNIWCLLKKSLLNPAFPREPNLPPSFAVFNQTLGDGCLLALCLE